MQNIGPTSGVYDAAMSRASHRKPRHRDRQTQEAATPTDPPPLAEAIGSAVAPADVGPDEELTPLDHDGLLPIAVFTAVWGVAAVVLVFRWADLADRDQTWWLWTCVAGFGLGLIGYAYSRRRRDALRAEL